MSSQETATILSARDIHKQFVNTEVLHGVDCDIHSGELTLITGPSGSGKTTFLNIISGIERASSGQIMYKDADLTDLNEAELTQWRGQQTGYAFQRSGLLGGLTAGENILAPHKLMENSIDKQWAGSLCARLGIAHLLQNSANTLSGGEKQRVAIARSLIHKPAILFADEPSAALDKHAKVEVHEMLKNLVSVMGITVAMVSHDEISVNYADRIFRLEDGVVTLETRQPKQYF